MESFVNTDLRNFGHEVGLLEQHQFAYSKFSLTTVALLKVVDSWKFTIDDGLKSVCVFLDLRKAFDVIKLYILLAKLESYRIKGNALQLFNSYLLGRSQFVVCRDSSSELRHLPFGVPHRSVLGPTLFNIHINNISKACHNLTILMLRYLQTIPRFILVPKTLARPRTELTRISKALTSGSLTMVSFLTQKRR